MKKLSKKEIEKMVTDAYEKGPLITIDGNELSLKEGTKTTVCNCKRCKGKGLRIYV